MTNPILSTRVTIEEIKIGYTYQVLDPNSFWDRQFGKACAIYPTRGEHGVVALSISGDGKSHLFFPEDLILVSKTA